MLLRGLPLVDVDCHTNIFTIAVPLATPKPNPIAVLDAVGLRVRVIMQGCCEVNVAVCHFLCHKPNVAVRRNVCARRPDEVWWC
jgi:hypothetical protein